MKALLLYLGIIVSCITALPVDAKPLNVTHQYSGPVGKYLSYLQEADGELRLDEVIAEYAKGHFTPSPMAFLRFGLDSPPVWLLMDVRNDASQPLSHRLSLERAWLDKVDFLYSAGEETHPLYTACHSTTAW